MSKPQRFLVEKIEFYLKKPKSQYEEIALISHPSHLEKLETVAKSTLIVSCDWLLMGPINLLGFDCVYFEFFLADADFGVLDTDLYLLSRDQIPKEERDVVSSKEVPINDLFVRDFSLVFIAYHRLDTGLSNMISQLNPSRILLFDMRCEFGLLSVESKKQIASAVCKKNSIELLNFIAAPSDDDEYLPQNHVYGYRGKQNYSRSLNSKALLYWFFFLTSQFLALFSARKKSLLFFTGGHLAKVFRDASIDNEITPHLNVISLVGNPIKLLRFLIKGGRVYYPRVGKRWVPEIKIKETMKKYTDFWESFSPKTVFEGVLKDHLINHVLQIDRLYHAMETYKAATNVLKRQPHTVVVVDSLLNIESQAVFNNSRALGTMTAYIWHGLWRNAQRFPALVSTDKTTTINTVWSWGCYNERWLEKIQYQGRVKRVGNPFSRKYIFETKKLKKIRAKINVLVLQYTPMNTDIYGMNGNQYSYFVNVLRYLTSQGFENITFKLHPGVQKLDYYKSIKEQFSLACSIHQDRAFEGFLLDADFVIGPSNSGAFIEALAAGKPYYPVCLSPSGSLVDLNYPNVAGSLTELFENIYNEKCVNSEMINEALFSQTVCPDPLKKIYEDVKTMSYFV